MKTLRLQLKASATHNQWPPAGILGFKDPRADSVALSAIHAFLTIEEPCDPLRTACIAMLAEGCKDHLGKVLEASSQKRVKPGNFIRMGPHTIATYFATAMEIHGPAFALLGNCVADALEIAEALLVSGQATHVVLILPESKGASVLLFGSGESFSLEDFLCSTHFCKT